MKSSLPTMASRKQSELLKAEGNGEVGSVVSDHANMEAMEKEISGDNPPNSNPLPTILIHDEIIFPGTLAPIHLKEQVSLKLLEENMPQNKFIGLAVPIEKNTESPKLSDLYPIAVLAKIIKLVPRLDNTVIILVHARERIRLTEKVQNKPYMKFNYLMVENILPKTEDDLWKASVNNLRDSAIKLISLVLKVPADILAALSQITDPALLTDFLAGNLSLEVEDKIKLLQQTDVHARLKQLQAAINNQIHIAELQKKLHEDVAHQFSDSQRRAYLREQFRAIQKELGEGNSNEEQVENLRLRLEEANLPEKVQAQAERELTRLEITPTASPEQSVIISYLETLAELPWNKLSEDNLDLDKAEGILNRDHHGLKKIKQRLLEFLAVRKLNPQGHGPILCFVGPPGVGKTSLGQSIADALGRQFVRISLGGLRDEAEIRGHRRTYIGSMPGRLIQEIRRAGTRNPVVMLDELDKLGGDFRGDPASALLEVLDPKQNHTFVDRYLDVPFDLSQIIFIATANIMDTVPVPLRDRMEVITLHGYTDEEKLAIAREYLVPRQMQENGISPDLCSWEDSGIQTVIEDYTREAGVRNLEREIGAVCRSVAADVARQGNPVKSLLIDARQVSQRLGIPRYVRDEALRFSQPGVVNGLAYTPVGGEVLHIEAILFPGTGKLTLTGQLGDVMKESATAAYSLVQSRAQALNIDAKVFSKTDVHLHVPSGAVPKDGPSAGIAIFTALASLFSGRAVAHDLAMTGEITLRGLVLPIGGLKEKALGALSSGIKRVLIPHLNEKDLEELPLAMREQLAIIPVRNIDEVMEQAIMVNERDYEI